MVALLITLGKHGFGLVKVAFDDSLLNLDLLLVILLVVVQDLIKVRNGCIHFALIVITHRDLLPDLEYSRLNSIFGDSVAQLVDLDQLLEALKG